MSSWERVTTVKQRREQVKALTDKELADLLYIHEFYGTRGRELERLFDADPGRRAHRNVIKSEIERRTRTRTRVAKQEKGGSQEKWTVVNGGGIIASLGGLMSKRRTAQGDERR